MTENQQINKKVKISSAAKAHKQSKKRCLRNLIIKSKIKTYTKKFLTILQSKNYNEAFVLFRKVQSLLFKAAQKNVIKFNKAVRMTSRFNKKIKIFEN
jgi:small subunit ribosomal protein S20